MKCVAKISMTDELLIILISLIRKVMKQVIRKYVKSIELLYDWLSGNLLKT